MDFSKTKNCDCIKKGEEYQGEGPGDVDKVYNFICYILDSYK